MIALRAFKCWTPADEVSGQDGPAAMPFAGKRRVNARAAQASVAEFGSAPTT